MNRGERESESYEKRKQKIIHVGARHWNEKLSTAKVCNSWAYPFQNPGVEGSVAKYVSVM